MKKDGIHYETPEDMESLGLTPEEAYLIWANWYGYNPPSNPEELRRLAIEASQLEHAHRLDSLARAIEVDLELHARLYGGENESDSRS